MCGGGGSDNSAEEARKREEARQGRIDLGAAELQRVFAELYGNEYRPVNQAVQLSQADFDALMGRATGGITSGGSQTVRGHYANLSDDMLAELAGLGFNTDPFKDGYRGNPAQNEARVRQEYERRLQESLRQQYQTMLSDNKGGFELIEGVKDPIWEQYRKAYLDSANTQMRQQMADAGQQVSRSYGRGQRGSSIQTSRSDDLYEQQQLAQLSINKGAEQAAVQRQAQVADAYNSSLATLNSTANPTQAVEQAQRELSNLSNLNNTPVLAQLFNTAAITGGAGYAGYQQGQTAARYNNIVNSPTGSNATVRW